MNFFIVNSFVDLKKADVKKDSIVIAGNVGARKSIELYKKAKELNFKIENFDDKRAETLLATFEKKKSLTKKKNTAKEEKVKAFEQATKKEAKKETKKAEPKKDANEEKKEEIKEQEKILTGKNTAM
jgi:type IV secretory pathway VirB9-like protein